MATPAHEMTEEMTVLDLIQVGEDHGLSPIEAFRAWWSENYRDARLATEVVDYCADVECRLRLTIDAEAARVDVEEDDE